MSNRPPNCKAYERGDQWFCDRCGVTWDLNDNDPPECKPYTYVKGKRIEDNSTFDDDPPVRVNVGTPGHIDHGSPVRNKEFAHNQVNKMREILKK